LVGAKTLDSTGFLKKQLSDETEYFPFFMFKLFCETVFILILQAKIRFTNPNYIILLFLPFHFEKSSFL